MQCNGGIWCDVAGGANPSEAGPEEVGRDPPDHVLQGCPGARVPFQPRPRQNHAAHDLRTWRHIIHKFLATVYGPGERKLVRAE